MRKSHKTLKRIGLFLLVASLAALFVHAVRPPHDMVATPQSRPTVSFQGGSGDTPATAVIIAGAPDYLTVAAGEYQYLGKIFGKRNRDWQVVKTEVYQHDAEVYDVITIAFSNNVKQQVFFDIS
ncbi:MAG: hypothetical protein ACLQUS_12595, partial [Desulfobaccales bacterium]